MEIYILVNSIKIKNMEKEIFIGLIYAKELVKKIVKIKFNNIKGFGGVDCLMVKDLIKKLMVYLFTI
jgi:hypothetical protein